MKYLKLLYFLSYNIIATFIVIKILGSGSSSFETTILAVSVIILTYVSGLSEGFGLIAKTQNYTLFKELDAINRILLKKNLNSVDEPDYEVEDKKIKFESKLLIFNSIFRYFWYISAVVLIVTTY